jgi:Arc/MetJ-type ribon-helix-helix transcriptional regulator
MGAMAMKRTSLHLDEQDLRILERIARQEKKDTGSYVSASMIVRRLIRQYLLQREQKKQSKPE